MPEVILCGIQPNAFLHHSSINLLSRIRDCMIAQEQLARYRLVNNEVIFLDFKWPWAADNGELAACKAAKKDDKGAKKK